MAPNSRDRLIFILERGVTAKAAFNALYRMIDSTTKLQYFLDYESSYCREIAKDQ